MNKEIVKSKKVLWTDYGIVQYSLASMNKGEKVDFHEFAVGDGDYEPKPDQTELENEVYRNGIEHVQLDGNTVKVKLNIPPDVGGFTIREIGLFDSEGNLLVVGVFHATEKPIVSDGWQKTIRYQVDLIVDNAAAITIKSDPNIDYATKEELEELRVWVMDNVLTPDNIHTKEVPGLSTWSNTVGGAINELLERSIKIGTGTYEGDGKKNRDIYTGSNRPIFVILASSQGQMYVNTSSGPYVSGGIITRGSDLYGWHDEIVAKISSNGFIVGMGKEGSYTDSTNEKKGKYVYIYGY